MAFSERYVDNATGSNLNGGFPIGGIYPVTSTNGAYAQGAGAGGTDRFTAAAGTPFSGCAAGDLISSYADGAAAPTGFVGRITAVNGGGASVDISLTAISGTRPTTAANGRTAKVGGAWAGPSGASAFPFAFVTNALTDASANPVRVNFKSGTAYAVTAAMTHANNGPITWEGYTTTAGDGGMAEIDGGATGASFVVLTLSGTGNALKNFHFDHNGDSGTAGQIVNITGTNSLVYRCRFSNAWRFGLNLSGGGTYAIECEAYACNLDDASDFGGFGLAEECTMLRCWSHDSAAADEIGFVVTGSASAGEPFTFINCIAENNGKHGWQISGSASVLMIGCDSVNNAEAGLFTTAGANATIVIQNSNFVDNGTFGIQWNVAQTGMTMITNCGFFSNTSGETTNVNASSITGSISYSASPYVDAANGDLSLNNTAGAGAAARNAGVGSFLQDGSIYSETTTGFPDVGAAQHDDTGGATTSSHTFA